MRASDLAGPSSFPLTEPVTFGETLNRLPDLAKWKHALTKKMTGGKGDLDQCGPSTTHTRHSLGGDRQFSEANNNHDREGDDGDDDDDDEAINDSNTELQKRSKKRKQGDSIMDRLSGSDDTISARAYSDDFLSHSTLAIHNPLTQYLKGKSSSSNNSKNQTGKKTMVQPKKSGVVVAQSAAKVLELDKIREQSRLAYQQLKVNRKLAR